MPDSTCRWMRAGWFRAVNVKSREAQALRMLLSGRKAVQGQAIELETMIRGLLRPFGLKVGQVSIDKFEARVRELVAKVPALEAIIEPLLAARAAMRLQFAKLHRLALGAVRRDEAV